MRFTFGYLAVVAIFLGTSSYGGSRADDEKITIDKLPKVITDAITKRFPDAKLVSAEKETEDGKTVYDVSIKHNDQSIEVTLTPEGKIVSFEKAIAAKDLPKAVTDSLEAKYPKATYKLVEEVYNVKDGEEKMETYEILLETAAKKKVEVLVTPEGKITKTTEQKPKKEEK